MSKLQTQSAGGGCVRYLSVAILETISMTGADFDQNMNLAVMAWKNLSIELRCFSLETQ